ncbi:DNA polymerase III subunit gamma/tau [Bordetella sp. 15P40C-2]|uniref:DNA polymerase III subunit gamma/tau n=1 Tax=Bordetella sp. 15P40C-2 TaxID=2572246 RepID=UPI00132325D5|nr:DNA polymerase III subunit gamma/tau [Bordetella sp. 15P40C-2]MVW71965.1 DNA polymerase III subunit gamma/tau [Bordetella sp. 15P40C-2]
MTYLVLARKWRPRSFDTLVGQDHVVRALTHALDTQRLHHAWLFTGTRGVGKTTLSRILAKSLNCETGITSHPCGKCRACTEIDAGRFVDYLELDAASNRGVEEMTQLLEQAVYAPGAGRYKVYMIDEVHMLTGHAFNAMLKTLEEPPPHVKFILATTDPQKIPVTVLSRCLQFNLKQMPPDAIVGHLQTVLREEAISNELPALRLIAQAASGSMRDALSLTDQAIAYSAGNLTEEAVRGMLGTIDQRHLVRLLESLAAGQAAGVLAVADELSTRGLSYSGALADLAVLLSRVAIEQRVPGATPADDPVAGDIVRLAGVLHPDAVQLFYSVAVHSRSELSLAPDEHAGFIMACLRMLALNNQAGPQTALQAPAAAPVTSSATPQAAAAAQTTATEPPPASGQAAETIASDHAAGAPAVATDQHNATSTGGETSVLPDQAATSASDSDIPPWEDLPEPPRATATSRGSQTAALAVTPAKAQPQARSTVSTPPASDDSTARPAQSAASPSPATPPEGSNTVAPQTKPRADDPPSWVNEDIPDDAMGGYLPDSAYTPDAEDEFETLASAGPSDIVAPASRVQPSAPRRSRQPRTSLHSMTAADWPALAAKLPVTGLAAELARQSEWAGVQGDAVVLRVAVKTLAESESRVRLQTVLCEHFGQSLRLEVEVGATGDGTAHAVAQIERAERQRAAEQAVAADPFVMALQSDFGGKVSSVRAIPPGMSPG